MPKKNNDVEVGQGSTAKRAKAPSPQAKDSPPALPTPAPHDDDRVEPAPGEYPCLSIRQPWADLILRGIKKAEMRSWSHKHRGPILLHASQTLVKDASAIPLHYGPDQEWELGGYVGIVDVIDIVPDPEREGEFLWLLENPRRIPFRKATGKLNLYRVTWPPSSPREPPRRTDHQTPHTRPPAVDELLALLSDDELGDLADALELDPATPDELREELAAKNRRTFSDVLNAIDDDLLRELVLRAGGQPNRAALKNVDALLHRLRYVRALDDGDLLSDLYDDPEPVPGKHVTREAGWAYFVDGTDGNLLRFPEGAEDADEDTLVQAGFITPEPGYEYLIADDGQVMRARVLTWAEVEAWRPS